MAFKPKKAYIRPQGAKGSLSETEEEINELKRERTLQKGWERIKTTNVKKAFLPKTTVPHSNPIQRNEADSSPDYRDEFTVNRLRSIKNGKPIREVDPVKAIEK